MSNAKLPWRLCNVTFPSEPTFHIPDKHIYDTIIDVCMHASIIIIFCLMFAGEQKKGTIKKMLLGTTYMYIFFTREYLMAITAGHYLTRDRSNINIPSNLILPFLATPRPEK